LLRTCSYVRVPLATSPPPHSPPPLTPQESLKKAGQKIGVVEKERTLEDDICEMCPQLTLQQRIGAFCGERRFTDIRLRINHF